VERSVETTRDDPDGEYLKRNRWFESGSLQQRVRCRCWRLRSLSYETPPQFYTIRLRAWLIRCGRYLRRGRMILAYPVLWTDFSRLNKRAERVLDRVPADALGTELCDDLACRTRNGTRGTLVRARDGCAETGHAGRV
jgi:hypothetical protein